MKGLFFEHSAWFLVLCAILALAYATILYYKDKKLDVSRKKIYFLALLRFLSVFLIASLLLKPFIKSIITHIEQPVVIFAVDNSKSIEFSYKDSTKNIASDINSLIDKTKKKFDTEVYSFDQKVYDSLKLDFSGVRTNITECLKFINNENFNRNVGAVVLVSDGIFNEGMNPAYSGSFPFHVYTIGLGDTTSYMDIKIKSVQTNSYIFYGDIFPVEVVVSAQKLKDKNFTLTIRNGNKILISDKINITNNNFVIHKTYKLTADKEGFQQYSISVTKFKNERNKLNNSKLLTINVIKNRQKVLILAANTSPDIAAMNRALETHKNFSTEVKFIDNFNTSMISDSVSMVILYNLPDKNHDFSKIWEALTKNAIPAIFVTGTKTDYQKFNSLNLGYSVKQNKNIFDEVHGYLNPEFANFEINSNLNKLLDIAPPVYAAFGNVEAVPSLKIPLFRKIKGIETSIPLVVLSDTKENYPANFSIIACENFWGIRVFDFKINKSTKLFDDFFMQIVQFTGIKHKRKNLIIRVKEKNYEGNEITFTAEVYDEIYQLVNDNDVSLKIIDSIGNEIDYIFDKTENAYKLDIGTLPAGKYSYIAKTTLNNKNLTAKGVFYVVKTDLEAQNLQADFPMLKKLALENGGKFLTLENSDSLITYLKNDGYIVPVSFSTKDISDVTNYKWLFFFILALLSLEWLLRKLYGTY